MGCPCEDEKMAAKTPAKPPARVVQAAVPVPVPVAAAPAPPAPPAHQITTIQQVDLGTLALLPGQTHILVYDKLQLGETQVLALQRTLEQLGHQVAFVGVRGNVTQALRFVTLDAPEAQTVAVQGAVQGAG